jgi:predicted dinucleotide-binding enzyme
MTVPKGMKVMSSDTQSISITRGDVVMRSVNFGVRLLNRVLGGGLAATSPATASSPTNASQLVAKQPATSSATPDAQSAAALAFAQLDQSNTGWSPIDATALVDRSGAAADHDAALATDDAASLGRQNVAGGSLAGLLDRDA